MLAGEVERVLGQYSGSLVKQIDAKALQTSVERRMERGEKRADAIASIEESHRALGRPIDLCLVHWPVPGLHVETYAAVQECVDRGLVKRAGLSNYTIEDYEELMASGVVTSAPPVVNQIEVSPFLYRKETVDYFQAKGLVVQAFKPLKRGAALADATVVACAARNAKTAAQVLLRWGVQRGLCVLVKSSSAARQQENMDVFDWALPEADMAMLDALTTAEALTTWRGHYEKRRAGTDAPWGSGPRPPPRVLL